MNGIKRAVEGINVKMVMPECLASEELIEFPLIRCYFYYRVLLDSVTELFI